MPNYILFSPVGGNDPVANFRDGSMLHIARVYKPKQVYLYLSKEMVEREEQDHRYTKGLEHLAKSTGHHFEKVELLQRECLVNVHLFDTFFEDFERIITQIHEENPESELLFNLSSGTPAMKSALYVLATTRLIKTLAIQVATPAQKENVKTELPESFDLEASLELNEDNRSDFVNRCFVAQNENLLVQFNKQSIVKLINAYDYSAALILAEQIKGFITKEALDYLIAAKARMELNLSNYTKILSASKVDFMPIKSGDKRKIFEYVLMLTVREKQGNYADFIRGLTPILLPIYESCLLNQCNININDYCVKATQYGNTVYQLSVDKMQKSEIGKRIYNKLQQRVFNDKTIYSTVHIFSIIEEFSSDHELIDTLRKLEDVRKKRNVVAHEVVGVNDAWIKSKTGLSSKEIVKALKFCMSKAGINISPDFWESYEGMNAILIEELLKESF